MRVALCHPTYWPEVRRGAERLTHDAAVALTARGHEVRIVTSHRAASSWSQEDGVQVQRLWRPPAGRLERRRFEPLVETAPLLRLALRSRPEEFVVGLQATDAAVAAATGKPSAYWCMGIPHRAWLTARRGRVELVRRALRCGAVLALSEHARDAFRTWLGAEAQVVQPPVDTVRFSPGGERSEDPLIVCAADAREPRKRVELLVAALPAIRREHPRARLVLDARTASAFAGIAGVELADMEELPALYRSAWVSALPSWGEAFGLVLAEALACGTPVVGARREGIPEVLGEAGGIGALFDGEDATAALLEALDLARDPDTAARCRARAEAFSADRCAARLEAVASTLM